MSDSSIYLDYNANAPLLPQVRDRLVACFDVVGNPAALHGFGKAQRALVEDSREQVARHLDALARDVIFTSGATEANNLALRGFPDHHLFTTAVEHASLWAHTHHRPHTFVETDGVGRLDLGHLESLLKDHAGPKMVAFGYANNETGVIHPVQEVVDMAHAYGALVFVDGVQAVGKLPFSFKKLGADMVSLSAHKVGALMGCGALLAREGISPLAQILGGGQERAKRSGTPNTLGIVSLGVALGYQPQWEPVREMRDRLEKTLCHAAPGAFVYGKETPRLPNTLAVSMPGVLASTQLMAFDLQGICVSSGSACSSGSMKTSRIFNHLNPTHAPWTVRISLGPKTTVAEVDRFADAWITLYKEQTL